MNTGYAYANTVDPANALVADFSDDTTTGAAIALDDLRCFIVL